MTTRRNPIERLVHGLPTAPESQYLDTIAFQAGWRPYAVNSRAMPAGHRTLWTHSGQRAWKAERVEVLGLRRVGRRVQAVRFDPTTSS